jgi:hypothetical protein
VSDGSQGEFDNLPNGETVAMVLRYLTWIPSGEAISDPPRQRVTAQNTAIEWQEVGTHAEWAELHGAKSGVLEGRMSELLGRAAVAGEQLGLAWTLDQEVQRWYAGEDEHPGLSMATRALAEMCGYYLLAAAHGLGNVTVRTLMLSPAAASALNLKRPRANGFSPFSQEPAAWPPLNSRLARDAMNAAQASGQGAAIDLAQVLVDLLAAPAWTALVNRRDTDYHRWRPQGLPGGGVPQRSLWDRPGPGTLAVSGGGPFFDPVDHKTLCCTASDGLDQLGASMSTWMARWPAALAALGVPVFKIATS